MFCNACHSCKNNAFTIQAISTLLHPHAYATLEWRPCTKLPAGICDAQAVVLNNKVYIGGGDTLDDTAIYTYDLTKDRWETLHGPTRYSALTTYHNKLLLVGGREASTGQTTNQLWVFEEGEQTWTQPLPPMPTRRRRAAAVSIQDHLIVAGGYDSKHLDTVEVFDGQQWVTADPLPVSCCNMKSASHDGDYYLMGGWGQDTSVFYTSLQSLVDKATQHPPTSPTNTDQPSVWKTLPNTPHQRSSTAIFGGALVAVGGHPNRSSLHLYSHITQSWLPTGEMPVGVHSNCTVTLPTGEMMVIGGVTSNTLWSPHVYKALAKLQ